MQIIAKSGRIIDSSKIIIAKSGNLIDFHKKVGLENTDIRRSKRNNRRF